MSKIYLHKETGSIIEIIKTQDATHQSGRSVTVHQVRSGISIQGNQTSLTAIINMRDEYLKLNYLYLDTINLE